MDGETYKSVIGEGGGVIGTAYGCGGGQGWWCVLYIAKTNMEVPEGCNCQVNVLQCTLEGVEIVVGKYISWKSVPLGYCSGKEAVCRCGRWIFVCICVGGWILFGCVRA